MSETPDVPTADAAPFDALLLRVALDPILSFLRAKNLHQGFEAHSLKAALDAAYPLEGPAVCRLRSLVRAGVEAGVLAPREQDGVRFGRLIKAKSPEEISLDCVHMSTPGPGHTHPQGEIDLCFAVSGAPTFDGQAPGWTVYEPGSWHVPTVAGGVMDILYFLPGGAIRFEAKPEA